MAISNPKLTFEVVYALVLESLAQRQAGSHGELVEDVGLLALSKGLIPRPNQSGGFSAGNTALHHLPHAQRDGIAEAVRQAMWRCLVRGLLVFGCDTANANFPWYVVTEAGTRAFAAGKPQPYDPDGFLDYFRRANPSADPVVLDYLAEAVNTFNVGSVKASAVMLGAASEKMILLLVDQLLGAIRDPAKQALYEKDLNKTWTVSHKYSVLKGTLDKIIANKVTPFPRDIADTIKSDLPAGFELLRRIRNVAGHPEVPGNVDSDGVFMNLRVFSEYARRVSDLLVHLSANQVDW